MAVHNQILPIPELQVALGRVSGWKFYEKFGRNPDVTAAEDIWNGVGGG